MRSHTQEVLAEADARSILEERLPGRIPFVQSTFVATPLEAALEARRLGDSVSIKGHIRGAAHKAVLGLVALDLRSPSEVEYACATMVERHQDNLGGFLVQRHARPGYDLFLSVTRDSTFGPCIVIGRGGGDVEEHGEVHFLPAAESSPAQIMSLLFSVVTHHATDGQLTRLSLVATDLLSLLEDDAMITDIEHNPIRMGTDDDIIVLDALITILPSEPEPVPLLPPIHFPYEPAILRGLSARDVTVVGVSRSGGGNGSGIVRSLKESGYEGDIYVVHPSGAMFDGTTTVKSFGEHLGSLDLVILSIAPGAFAPVLRELEDKDVGLIIAITALPPQGDAARGPMEEAIRTSKHAIVGPNTGGLLSSPGKLRASAIRTVGMRPDITSASIGLATQSGSIGSYLVGRAFEESIGIRHWIPTGNELTVQLHDVVHAMAADPEVKAIGLFIEGVRHGPALLEALDTARRAGKFVAAYCIGRTEEGKSAAISHTAALSGNHAVLTDVLRSRGVLVVEDTVTLFDTLKLAVSIFEDAWQSPQSSTVPKVIVLSTSGGSCSIAAEEFSRRGHPLPVLDAEVETQLKEILPSYASVGNPTDVTFDATIDPSIFSKALSAIAKTYSQEILYFPFGTQAGPTALETADQIIEIHGNSSLRVIISRLGPVTLWPEVVEKYRERGIPVFDSPHTAVRVLCVMLDHLKFLKEEVDIER